MRYLFFCAFALLLKSPDGNLTAQTITTIAGNGVYAYGGDGGPATAASMALPIDVYASPSGNIYIADEFGNRIRMVNSAGIMTTAAGNGTTPWGGTGVQATAAGMNHPRAIRGDAAGNLYLADEGNQRIRKITTDGLISNIAGNGTAAYTGDGFTATDASIDEPWGVCTDAAGNVYIADEQNQVVRKVSTAGIITTFAGTTGGYSGDGGQATAAKLTTPVGLCADAAGNIYIADNNKNVIRKVNPSGIITTIVGNGGTGHTGDGGPATAATLNAPWGICLDAFGNLYIAEQGNNAVRKVTAAGIITTYAGNGSPGYGGDNGPATAAKLNAPTGVSMDASGNLYIADYQNQRIRMVTPYNVETGSLKNPNTAIRIYPNPTGSVITIESPEPVNAVVYAMDGRLLMEKREAARIDLTGLPSGNYAIRLSDTCTGARVHDEIIIKN